MKKLLLLFILINYCCFGQLNLNWEETNTGSAATISVGEFVLWGMSNPTLNGEVLPSGSLIGVFYIDGNGDYACGAGETWLGDGMIALSPWGDDSTTGDIDGFSDGESFNWFVRVCDGTCWSDSDGDGILDADEVLDGTDYYSSDAVMVSANGQLTGTTYATNALTGLESSDFTEYTEDDAGGNELEECSCLDGTATQIVSSVCFIPVGGCTDIEASNYCYTGSLFPVFSAEDCQYEGSISGCMCDEAQNFDSNATIDDGSCIIVNGGCSNPLANNYSGEECASGIFIAEECELPGCICDLATNFDPTATIDDGSCVIMSGGCSNLEAINYSGDECASGFFISEDCQLEQLAVGPMDYTITDGNMIIQVSNDVVLFNDELAPSGATLGVFYTSEATNELLCGGNATFSSEENQYAIAAWKAEGADNGFQEGEVFTWVLQIGSDFFVADMAMMNTESIFSDTFTNNGFGQVVSLNFSGELTSILGCTDSSAFNYNPDASFDDGSCYNLEFSYTITDANMTIQVSQSAIQFNGVEPSCGSLLGGFYTNDNGELTCAGYQVWCDDFSNNQLAVPLFAAETGFDNGFDTGESITWVLSVSGQNFIAESSTMNPVGFSTNFTPNGFGQLLVGIFNGDILGCIDETACNYNIDANLDDGNCDFVSCLGCLDETACNYDNSATIDDNSCILQTVWFSDVDEDGLGAGFSITSCNDPSVSGGMFVDNNEDICPNNSFNISGCTDINSFNYNENACFDDGSCILVILGCTDDTAFNYDSSANTDDGSCISVILGCTDDTAFNYDSLANTDNNSCCYIAGCTNENSINYNPNACLDNNSCIATILGCTDFTAFNYDSTANTDDGSCISVVLGCIDDLACNYNLDANTTDGSCTYPEQFYDCSGSCLNDNDGDLICDELETLGCTDNTAFNYNELATEDDGSCIAVVLGCTDLLALNYDSSANTDEGNCCYVEGCIDSTAFNYNENACFDNGTCISIVLGCTDFTAFNYDSSANTDDGSCLPFTYGCLDLNACNYDDSVNTDDGSCTYPDDFYNCDGSCISDIDNDGVCDQLELGGCTNSNALNYNPEATEDSVCIFTGCLNATACNFDPNGIFNEFVDCEYESCAGCTNPEADNYNSSATIDDGTCIVSGCTDFEACNYNIDANNENFSCLYPIDLFGFDFVDCSGVCLNDSDVDGVCDEIEVFGCTDLEAFNYIPSATEDDGSCEPVLFGCLDNSACNYDESVNTDDGSCNYPIEGFDCDGNQLDFDTPWGNNSGCAFNNHVVGFSLDGLNSGDYVGVFYLDDNGNYVFSQGIEYIGSNFSLTICGDDETTLEKDGFDSNEPFFWQIWPAGEDCSYPMNVEYSENQPSAGSFEFEGISEIISYTGSPLSVSLSVSDVTCNGGSDGFVTLDINGGIAFGDASYIIEGDLENLTVGNYFITVTDYNGCQEIIEFTINEPDLLNASFNAINVSCNGANDGSIDVVVEGGAGIYTYQWSNGETTQNISDVIAGSYDLLVIDENECTASIAVEITEPNELLLAYDLSTQYSGYGVSCYGESDGFIDVTVEGGTGIYSYLWSNGEITQNLTGITAGFYDLVVTDENGCSASIDVEIEEPSQLESLSTISNYNGYAISCFGGSDGFINVSTNGGAGDYTYIWSGTSSENISNLGSGTYYLTTIDSNGCSIDSEFIINEPTEINVTVSVENPECYGNLGSADINVSGGIENYTYLWLDQDGTPLTATEQGNIENIGAGIYTVLVTDENGCENTESVEISEPSEFTVTGISSNYGSDYEISCNGANDGFIDVTVEGGTFPYTYNWSNGLVSQDLYNLTSGTYVLIVTDFNGCEISLNFTLEEPESLLITSETTSGEYSNCSSGSASVFVTGGTEPYEYLWSNGAIDSEITSLCGGEYFVTITDGNGCVVEQELTVDYLSPEGWDVTETNLLHTIDIPADAVMLLDQVTLTPGDYVGVFFDNEDGTQTCGGYAMWIDENTQVIAYGNDGSNNGFDELEQFKWRVWNNETETQAYGFVVYDDSYSDERNFIAGGESGILASIFATYQSIPLNENPYTDWDIISTYINSNENVQSMFEPILEELVIIKDANGLVYWPDLEINTLVNLNNHDAFGIKTLYPNELTVYGDFIQPEDIEFNLAGWNYISYPRYLSMPLESALLDLLGNIKLLKDDSGNVYWPELNINTVDQLFPGEGYVLKVFEDQLFNFPSNSDGIFNIGELVSPNYSGRLSLDQPSYYTDFQKTNNNMTIGIPLDVWNDFEIQDGDEIAVLDLEGNIFGVAILENSNNVLVVWGNDDLSMEKDGMFSGEKLFFELWDESTNNLYDLNFTWQEGDDNYIINGISIVSNASVTNKQSNVFKSIKCYPNPNTGAFNIEMLINNETDVVIDIFNSIGKKVYSYDCGLLSIGSYNLPFSLKNNVQGMYYLEVRSDFESKKIVFNITE